MACGVEEADIEEATGLQNEFDQRRDVEDASSSTQHCKGSAQRGCISCGSAPPVPSRMRSRACMKCKTSLAVVSLLYARVPRPERLAELLTWL